MYNLYFSPKAQSDLAEIRDYITNELENPTAVLATISKITKKIRILKNHALAGALLSSIVDIESDYRFLVSGSYLVFYRVYGKDIYVDRILYGRRDYMRILFGDTKTIELDE